MPVCECGRGVRIVPLPCSFDRVRRTIHNVYPRRIYPESRVTISINVFVPLGHECVANR